MDRYFLRKLKKVKKSNGQILAINEVLGLEHASTLLCLYRVTETVVNWELFPASLVFNPDVWFLLSMKSSILFIDMIFVSFHALFEFVCICMFMDIYFYITTCASIYRYIYLYVWTFLFFANGYLQKCFTVWWTFDNFSGIDLYLIAFFFYTVVYFVQVISCKILACT